MNMWDKIAIIITLVRRANVKNKIEVLNVKF